MMDIHAQLELQDRREEERKLLRINQENDFKAVANTKEGRRFINRILGECGIYASTFNTDAATAAYMEGRRSIGLWVNSMFYDCPNIYIQMLMEQKTDVDRTSSSSDGSNTDGESDSGDRSNNS